MSVSCVVFAAGSGTRFGGTKQFAKIGEERLVDRVVRTAASCCDEIVLVLPPGVVWDGAPVTSVVAGGESHAASVRAGVAAVDDDADVIVLASPSHPLASALLYERVIAAVHSGADAAAPAGLLADALKQRDGDRVVASVDKRNLVAAQSPGAFRADSLRSALATQEAAGFADVAEELELIERSGGAVLLVEGDPINLHITTPRELAMAQRLLGL